MKKILTLILSLVLIFPACLLVGCKDDKNNASSVKNTVYYITKVTKKTEDITKEYTDGNFKIIFQDKLFLAEIYDEKTPSKYGYYSGTYSTNEDKVNFEVTEAKGYYSDYKTVKTKGLSVFTSLRYKNGKLYTELVLDGNIYSFTLEQK